MPGRHAETSVSQFGERLLPAQSGRPKTKKSIAADLRIKIFAFNATLDDQDAFRYLHTMKRGHRVARNG